MSFDPLTGSHDSGRHVAATQSRGPFAVQRPARAHMTHSIQAYLTREHNGAARHDSKPQGGAGDLPRNGVAVNGACLDRPRFPRFHASIAERQLDWGWQQCPDAAPPSDESERREVEHAGQGFSGRALWLGGVAFALLAGGVISALATFQSSRPLPFEAWAQGDLMQRAGGMAVAMPGGAIAPGQSADAVMGTAGHDRMAALVEPVAARPGPGATPASASVDREPGEVDAAFASNGRLEPFEIEVAVLGPILASAATAEKLAANVASSRGSLPAAGTRGQRLLPEPPRPVFKPELVASSRREPGEAARRPSRT